MKNAKYAIDPNNPHIAIVFGESAKVCEVCGIDRLVGRREVPVSYLRWFEAEWSKKGVKLELVDVEKKVIGGGGLWRLAPIAK